MADRADRPEADEAKKPARERSANRVFPAGVLVRGLERVADKVGRGGVRGEDLVIEEGGKAVGTRKRSGSFFTEESKQPRGADPCANHLARSRLLCAQGVATGHVRCHMRRGGRGKRDGRRRRGTPTEASVRVRPKKTKRFSIRST